MKSSTTFACALCLAGANFLIGMERSSAKQHPIWWSSELQLKQLSDISARLSDPFSKEQMDEFAGQAFSFSGQNLPQVKNCQELLSNIDPDWGENAESDKRIVTWGDLGSTCAILKELSHAVSAKQSAVYPLTWNAALFPLLPAGICWAPSVPAYRAAQEAEKQGLSLTQFTKARLTTRKDKTDGTIYISQDGHDVGIDYYLLARGDFDGDGWEDLIVKVVGSAFHSARAVYSAFVITRQTPNGKFRMVKEIF